MTQPSDWDNLLAALEADPNLREALRRHILTDELLNLPVTVANLATNVEKIAGAVVQLQEAVVQLQTDMTTVKGDIGLLKSDIASVKDGLGEVQRTQIIQSGVFSEAAGAAYENTAIRLAPRLFRRHLGLTDTALFSHYPEGQNGKLQDMAKAVSGNQAVTAEELEDLLETDMLFTAKEPSGQAYVLAEASLTVQANDVIRARRRAGILDRITGLGNSKSTVIAVVIGKAISEDAQALLFEPGNETGIVTFLMANADAPET